MRGGGSFATGPVASTGVAGWWCDDCAKADDAWSSFGGVHVVDCDTDVATGEVYVGEVECSVGVAENCS